MFARIIGSHNGDESGSSKEEEPSLTTILPTSSDRAELIELISNITDVMRKRIDDNFDGLSLTDVQSVKLSTSLKQYFESWREKVLGRIGEVINSKVDEAHSIVNDASKPTSLQHDRPSSTDDQSIDHITDSATVKSAMHRIYPAIKSPLVNLPISQRALVLHSILLLLLSLKTYSSYSRILLVQLCTCLNLPVAFLARDEAKLAHGLLSAVNSTEAHSSNNNDKDKDDGGLLSGSKWKVGLATVAGAAIVGITGGLAAPLLAAGVGSVMGGIGLGATATAGYLGAVAGSSIIVGGLFGAYGGKMTGEMMERYAKEVEDFAFLPVQSTDPSTLAIPPSSHSTPQDRHLRLTIGISGWINSPSDILSPWKVFSSSSSEPFALRFELSSLLALGSALTTLLKSTAWTYARTEIIKRTLFATIQAALWPLALLKVGKLVDNPFSTAKIRADKAGLVLADALTKAKVQGERPVSLVGYSLGARVIYQCLKTLADREQFGIIEDVVVLGAAVPDDVDVWRRIKAVVAGRVVNVYSENDLVLGFLYRSASVQYGVAGLQVIGEDEGKKIVNVENLNFSEKVAGHTAWRYVIGDALREIGWSGLVEGEVEKQNELGVKNTEEEEKSRKEDDGKEAEEEKTLEEKQNIVILEAKTEALNIKHE